MPLIVAALALSPSADPRLTLTQTATVDALIQEISAQAKIKLEAERLGKEILIVSLQDAPLSEAMDRIAWATFGRWEKTSGGYRLVGDAGQRQRAERDYIERAAKVAAESIARFRSGVLAVDATDLQVEKAALPPRPDPGSGGATAADARLLARLLGYVSPSNFVGLTPEGQTVHATNPTPAEFGFGPDVAPILNRYAAEMGWPSISERPLRVMLKGSCSPQGGYASLVLYTMFKGRWEHRTTGTNIQFQPANPVPVLPKELLDAIPATAPIPLSEISRSMVFPKDSEMPADPTPAFFAAHPALVKRLREPERFEPLGTFLTDAWTAAGAITHRNVVANVDDTLIFPYLWYPVPSLREALQVSGRLTTRFEPGWIATRPQLWNAPWGHRADRAALGRYVRSKVRNLELESLDATAEFLNGAGSTISRGMGYYVSWASEGRLSNGFDEFGGQGLYLERFYAALPEAIRRAWRDGTPVDVATLPSVARRALRNWAIARNYEGPNPGQILNPPIMEPTVSFPDGEANQGRLQGTTRIEPGYSVRYDFGEGIQDLWFNEQGLANWLKNSNPDRKQIVIQAASRRVVRLAADLPADQPSPFRTWRDPQPDPAKYVPWSQSREISARFGG